MRHLQTRSWIAILILTGCAAAVLVLPGGWQPVRAVLGLCLVLVAPGLAVTTAVLPVEQLGTAEHALLAVAASISIAIFGGLVLNLTPWGLQPGSWPVLLFSVTGVGAVFAWLRLSKQSGLRFAAPRWEMRPDQLALPVAAVFLLGLAIYVARIPAPPERYQGYTALWMVPNDERAAAGARIGLQSGEFESTRYRLEVYVDGMLANAWPVLELHPNEQWETEVTLPAGEPTGEPTGMTVEARLYRADAPRILYRQVRFHAGSRAVTSSQGGD